MKEKLSGILLIFIALNFSLSSCGTRTKNAKDDALSGSVIENAATAGKPSDPGQMPAMSFPMDEHDFGRLIQGTTVSYGFKFTNTGGSDLVIASVSSSCGCTVTDYPKDPVKPGKDGLVMVTFKTEGKRGFQHKTVTVMANTQPNTKVLKISAEVRLPEDEK